MRNSPTALRLLKSAMNAVEDGQSGLQQLGGDATMLFYNSEEGNEVSLVPMLFWVVIQVHCLLAGARTAQLLHGREHSKPQD